MTVQNHRVSPATDDLHRNVLAAIRREKEELLGQLAELEFAERFHSLRAGLDAPASLIQGSMAIDAKPAGTNGVDISTNAGKLPKSATKHDAAAFALKAIGKPAKIGQMVDYLVSIGYGAGITRRLMFNGLYLSMKRREKVFEAVGDAKWRLKPEKAAQEGSD